MEYQKLNPSNANIFIDYKNKKNPVSFDYPQKSSAFKMVLYAMFNFSFYYIYPLLLLFLFLNIPLFIFFKKDTSILALLFFFSYFFLLIISFPISYFLSKNERFLKFMPEFNKHIRTFFFNYNFIRKTKLTSKEFEIPLFNNVFLDYKLRGDFKKYITNVEIIALDYQYRSKIFFFKIKDKNVDYFKARFVFSKVPKKGFMEVKYF